MNTNRAKQPWAMTLGALAAALLLSACNSSSSPTAFIESARGTWQTGCQNNGIVSDYGQVTLAVGETTFEFTNTFFQDPQCSNPTVKYVSSGELTKHDKLARDDLSFVAEIDFLIAQVNAEVLNATKQTQFNNEATCGLLSWQVGVSVDVSNCPDVLGSNVPRTEYDLYSTATRADADGVTADVLYTGQLRGATDGDRPTEPDYQNPYWRIGDVSDLSQ